MEDDADVRFPRVRRAEFALPNGIDGARALSTVALDVDCAVERIDDAAAASLRRHDFPSSMSVSASVAPYSAHARDSESAHEPGAASRIPSEQSNADVTDGLPPLLHLRLAPSVSSPMDAVAPARNSGPPPGDASRARADDVRDPFVTSVLSDAHVDIASTLAEFLTAEDCARLSCVSTAWALLSVHLIRCLHVVSFTALSAAEFACVSPVRMRQLERLDLRTYFPSSTPGRGSVTPGSGTPGRLAARIHARSLSGGSEAASPVLAPQGRDAWVRNLAATPEVCTRIRTLLLANTVPRSIVHSLFHNCNNVETLASRGMNILDDEAVCLLTSRRVRNVDLNGCWRLTDAGVGFFIERNAQTLRKILLGGLRHVSDTSLQLLAACPCLSVVSLDGACRGITVDGITAIAGHAALTALQLSDFTLSTDQWCAVLQAWSGPVRAHDGVQIEHGHDRLLELCGCAGLTPECMALIASSAHAPSNAPAIVTGLRLILRRSRDATCGCAEECTCHWVQDLVNMLSSPQGDGA